MNNSELGLGNLNDLTGAGKTRNINRTNSSNTVTSEQTAKSVLKVLKKLMFKTYIDPRVLLRGLYRLERIIDKKPLEENLDKEQDRDIKEDVSFIPRPQQEHHLLHLHRILLWKT